MSIKMQKKFSTKSLQNETEPQLKTALDREQPARRRYVPSDFFAVWVTIWVNPKSKRMDIIFSPQRKRKVPDFLRNQELFGGDYWTRTSDLLRVKMRRDVKALLLGAFRHFWPRFLLVQITALSTVSTR